MKYMNLSIEELHQLLLSKKVTPLELTKEALELCKEDSNNCFETICEKEALEFAASLKEVEEDNLLWGIPFLAKDNFSTKGILTTGSSDILKDYVPVYDATVIEKLKEKKCVLIGKTTLDELAMGGSGMTGHLGRTYNPYDPTHTYMIGGSSCGSASATANAIVPFALGSDTGDSVRKPASYGGLVGFKPSWGRISRYGLFPFAPSLDHVAYFTRSVADSAILLDALAGRDEMDMTSSFKEKGEYYKELTKNIKGKKIAIIKEINESIKDETILNAFNETCKIFEKLGATVVEVSIPKNLLNAIYPTYLVISCAEATSNNANLDGVKFGPRVGKATSYQEVMMNARTQGFGELIKRRFVIGSYALFKSNQEIRHLIVNRVNDILKDYDAIYAPCVSTAKNAFDNNSKDKMSDEYLIAENHMAIGNFAGLPSLTLPIGVDQGFPFGANITTRAFDEQGAFNLAYALESELPYKGMSARRNTK